MLFPPVFMMERLARCHKIVLLDNAQFDRDCAQFRIMSRAGELLVSTPVADGPFRAPFSARRIVGPGRWRSKTLQTLRSVYGRQRHFPLVIDWVEGVIGRMLTDDWMDQICSTSLVACCEALGIEPAFYRASDVLTERPLEPTDWIASLAGSLGASDYLQGETSLRAYFREGPFESRGIQVWAQRFFLSYESHTGQTGHAGLSILDLLFTHGFDEARQMLRADLGPGRDLSCVEVEV